jgi:signal transduction histidine kinase
MDARRARTWRRVARFGVAIAGSEAITALMCFAFNGTVRLDFMVTGVVCAVAIAGAIEGATSRYRHRLAEANAALERRVLERTAELEQANRLAAAVSHEIRTPLSVITLAAADARDAAANPEQAEMLDDVVEAAARIATILRDLSALTTRIDEPLGSVDVGGVVDIALRLVSYEMRGKVRLVRDAFDVPPIAANPSRLVQVVLNLLINAVRAAPADRPCTVRVAASADDGEVVLRVIDDGVGMDAATRARVFEPYFTTRGDRGGTGLGLAICRDIVTAAGGRIEVDSAPGHGTTMSVHLRRYGNSRRATPAMSELAGSPSAASAVTAVS